MASFLSLNLTITLKCLDCGKICKFKFRTGDYFNLEGNFLGERPEQTVSCADCGLEVFCDLEIIYSRQRILKYYDGFRIFQEEN